jgi:hypothetical protein
MKHYSEKTDNQFNFLLKKSSIDMGLMRYLKRIIQLFLTSEAEARLKEF